MLSYQHIYHAGNLADVHKHAVLARCLSYLTQKPKPLSYIETHAGRGLYQLDAAESLKTGEAAQGIEIAESWFDPAHPYRELLAQVRDEHGGQAYPGSPMIASRLLRGEDVLHLAELHPQEVAALRGAVPAAHIHQLDGLKLGLAIAPPTPRRGFCLIDPSYEIKSDYEELPIFIRHLHRKWPVGIIMLWYPMLIGDPHVPMLQALHKIAPDALTHEVQFPPAREGHRMRGSGIWMLNAPYGIETEMKFLSNRFSSLT